MRAAVVVLTLVACSPTQAPRARTIGKAMSLGSVGGLVGAGLTNGMTDHTAELLVTFSVTSIIGLGLYAAGDLATPAAIKETLPERNTRWAKILTERAAGAARDGRCERVQRIEIRVRDYDREIHDFVFMRDPEIAKCMTDGEPVPASVPSAVP
jgi:hypothetical protein